MSRMTQALSLVVFLVLCFGAGALGAQFTTIGEWYASLNRPFLTPPNWVFAPVWTVLYAMMAAAAWLVWKEKGLVGAAIPLGFFLAQLVLNGIWTWLFFGRHQLGLAFLDIAMLWCLILVTLVLFWQISRPAGILLVPYLAWVSFASYLSLSYWLLNRG